MKHSGTILKQHDMTVSKHPEQLSKIYSAEWVDTNKHKNNAGQHNAAKIAYGRGRRCDAAGVFDNSNVILI